MEVADFYIDLRQIFSAVYFCLATVGSKLHIPDFAFLNMLCRSIPGNLQSKVVNFGS